MSNNLKPSSPARPISTSYSYYALTILSMLNLLNYIDRFIFSALIPNIKADMHLNDEQIGYIGSAFTIVYTIFSPIYGYLADRRARAPLIASGIAIWSVATAMAGVAQSYTQMLIARATVGIGEASYATISPGFLSDYFDRKRRGIAFGIFFTAVPLGQALGFILAGKLSDPNVLGWRHTFYVVGLPGLLMAVAAYILREPERGKMDEAEAGAGHIHGSFSPAEGSVLDGYKSLAKNYYYVMATLGYSSMTFALGALSYWGLELLVSNKHIDKGEASTKLGIYITLAGLIGTLVGGWIGDQLMKVTKSGYFILCGISAALAAIPLTITLASPNPQVFFPAIFTTVLLLFLGNGPVNAIIINSVAPSLRSTAVATSILAIHLLGDALSQPLVGKISTVLEEQAQLPGFISTIAGLVGLTQKEHLGIALLITPLALILAGLFFALGLRRDPSFKLKAKA